MRGYDFARFIDEDIPAEQIDWYDAIGFCNRLSDLNGFDRVYTEIVGAVICDFDANGYRLPTEVEWEFAARGWNISEGYSFSGSDLVSDISWNKNNSAGYITHPVGTKALNELGIFDMSDNVFEWCWDWA